MINDNRPIGVFDSGVGGLTVLRRLIQVAPHQSFLYYADTAHLPYGDKSPTQIKTFSHQIAQWMIEKQHVKAIVVACHTSSAIATPFVNIPVPVIDVISPLPHLLREYRTVSVGILATRACAATRMHEQSLRKAGFCAPIITIDCPELVPKIEAGQGDDPLLRTLIAGYAQRLGDVSVVVMGCTHYPFVSSTIEDVMQRPCIDPAQGVTDIILPLCKSGGDTPILTFFCSKDPALMAHKITQLTGFVAPVTLCPL